MLDRHPLEGYSSSSIPIPIPISIGVARIPPPPRFPNAETAADLGPGLTVDQREGRALGPVLAPTDGAYRARSADPLPRWQ